MPSRHSEINALNPNHPCQRGSAQNPDIFFQAREACNPYYDAMPAIVQEYMDKVNAKIGTDYKLFNYYGAADAENVIVAMGSVCDTIEETIDYLVAAGEKVGVVKGSSLQTVLRRGSGSMLFRRPLNRSPFLTEPKSRELLASRCTLMLLQLLKEPNSTILRYSPAVTDWVPRTPHRLRSLLYTTMLRKQKFTIGIVDDVTNLSLETGAPLVTTPEGTINCKFWGLGADGTVGANKNSIKIIGDNTDMYAQAYFDYDSKKSGGVTMSHLRFGKKPIKSTYLIHKANFVACHNPSYVTQVQHGTGAGRRRYIPAELPVGYGRS